MRGTVVGVLRGGPSKEHDVSLASGHAILTHLPEERFTTRDIYIDRAGNWHVAGKAMTPEKALRMVDSVLIGLHGEYGEDGEVQKVLERYGIPYSGSDSFASYVAMHKVLAKERAREHGILTPRYRFVEEGSDVEKIIAEVVRTFPQPVVIKPVKWGSSVGVSFATGHAPIYRAVMNILKDSGGVLIEEKINGTETTVGVVEHLRDEPLYALPVVAIYPPEKDFFSYEAKYSGSSREVCPAQLPKQATEEMQRIAQTMHKVLGLRDYSRSDFILSPRGIYYLETNTLPGLTSESLFPKSLAAVGVSFPDFLTHLVERSLKR